MKKIFSKFQTSSFLIFVCVVAGVAMACTGHWLATLWCFLFICLALYTQEQVNAFRMHMKNNADTIEAYKEELEERCNEINLKDALVGNLEVDVKFLEDKCKGLEFEKNKINKELGEKECKLIAAEREIGNLKMQVEQLEANNKRMATNNATYRKKANAEIEASKTKVDEAIAQLEQCKADVGKYQELCKKADDATAEAVRLYNTLEEAHRVLKTEHEAVCKHDDDAHRERIHYKKQYDAEKKRREELQESFDKVCEQRNKYERECEALEKQVKAQEKASKAIKSTGFSLVKEKAHD